MANYTAEEKIAAAKAMMYDVQHGTDHGCLLGFVPTDPSNVNVRGHVDFEALAAVALNAAAEVRNSNKS